MLLTSIEKNKLVSVQVFDMFDLVQERKRGDFGCMHE